VKLAALALDGLCVFGLACASACLFALSIPLWPYFAWLAWKEHRNP